MTYDVDEAPDPKAWLELDEDERINLAVDHHRRVLDDPPNLRLHAAIHVVVENQLAMGLESAARALRRLMDEGLDRHDAVHAVGSVVAEQMHELLVEGSAAADPQGSYDRKLDELTAEGWRKSFE